MNTQNQTTPSTASGAKGNSHLKAAVIDLFKKSQRLPPLSLVRKKRTALTMPPHGLELGDFYHL